MSIFSSDDFNGTPGDELSVYNPLWVKVTGLTGSYVITDAFRARPSTTVNTAYYRDDVPPSADYKTTARVRIVSVAAGFRVGVAARVSTSANSMYFVRLNGTTGWELYKRTAGTNTQLGSTVAQSLTAGDEFVIEIEVSTSGSDAVITVRRNGSVIIGPITDSSSPFLSAGRPGIYSLNSTAASNTTGYHIDEFRGDTLGGGTTVSPGAGALTYTGNAPTVSQPRTVSPGAGALTYTGHAPTVTQPRTVRPVAGGLTYVGNAPTVAQPRVVRPAAGRLAYTGHAPTVSQASGTTVRPIAGQLTYSGHAPTVTQPRTVRPIAGRLAYTGNAPVVSQPTGTRVRPGTGALTYTGHAPRVAQPRTVRPGAGRLTYAGNAPAVSQPTPGEILPPATCRGWHAAASSATGGVRLAATATATVEPLQ